METDIIVEDLLSTMGTDSNGEIVPYRSFLLATIKEVLDKPIEDMPKYLSGATELNGDDSDVLKLLVSWRLDKGV
jgi:hypothetical protein